MTATSTALLTPEQRQALETALAMPGNQSPLAVFAAMGPVVNPGDDPEYGMKYVDLARWLLAADAWIAAAVREAYNRAVDDAADIVRQCALGSEHRHVSEELGEASDTVAALRQEQTS